MIEGLVRLAPKWVRAGDYEVIPNAQRSVRAKLAAPFEGVDPAGDFINWRRTYREQVHPAPYDALLDLAPKLTMGEGGRLTEESEAAVLRFCREYGMLGTLLHSAEQVTLAPRWERALPGASKLAPFQTVYTRTANGWHTERLMESGERRAAVAYDSKMEGALVEPLGGFAPPAIVRRTPVSPALLIEKPHAVLAGTLGAFVGQAKAAIDTAFIQPPGADEFFWRGYMEPVRDYWWWAKRFASALELAGQTDPAKRTQGLAMLTDFLAPMRIGVEATAEGIRPVWSAPSLLSLFAAMAVQDLMAGALVKSCQECGRLFVTSVEAAEFCKGIDTRAGHKGEVLDNCRSRRRVRRYRELQLRKQEAAAKNRKKGQVKK